MPKPNTWSQLSKENVRLSFPFKYEYPNCGFMKKPKPLIKFLYPHSPCWHPQLWLCFSFTITRHLLLHCPIASNLWYFLFCLVGISWVMPNSVASMLKSWNGKLGSRRYGTVRGRPGMFDVAHLGWKELPHFTKSPLYQNSSFISEDSLWMGIEVLHSVHVFSNGFPRYSTFVPLFIRLVLCMFFSSLVLLYCFSLICILPVYTFWFLNNCNYLSKNSFLIYISGYMYPILPLQIYNMGCMLFSGYMSPLLIYQMECMIQLEVIILDTSLNCFRSFLSDFELNAASSFFSQHERTSPISVEETVHRAWNMKAVQWYLI